MTFNQLLESLGVNQLDVVMQKDLNGQETGYATSWDQETRTRVVLTPEALEAAADPNVNNFVAIKSNPTSADKQVEDKETGKITTIPGEPYINQFVILGEPRVTLGQLT